MICALLLSDPGDSQHGLEFEGVFQKVSRYHAARFTLR
jgi:hypothetical protein